MSVHLFINMYKFDIFFTLKNKFWIVSDLDALSQKEWKATGRQI